MFKKMMIANRGEIAVRIIQTCRELGIPTLALYESADSDSLHVRFADEAVQIQHPFTNMDEIFTIAKQYGVDAIHPGYGFYAETPLFSAVCEANNIHFIGAAPEMMKHLGSKLTMLKIVREAGIRTVETSDACEEVDNNDHLLATAEKLGYPLVVKSCRGGRGPGQRLVRQPEHLLEAVRSSRAEALVVFGTQNIYLEKAFLPASQIGVQILVDQHGNAIHLGEHEGSLVNRNRKLIEEAPSPLFTPERRAVAGELALKIAKLIGFVGVGTVEFIVDRAGELHFTEMKSRIQTEHPLVEMLSRIDLVREQICIAAGAKLDLTQTDTLPRGHAIMARVMAEDPFNRYLSSPGRIDLVRVPTGVEVRVDKYIQGGSNVPGSYSPLIGKLTVWGATREQAVRRMQRALSEFVVRGIPTNIPRLLEIVNAAEFVQGEYHLETMPAMRVAPPTNLTDAAAIAAVVYLARNTLVAPTIPPQFTSRWQKTARRLPE